MPVGPVGPIPVGPPEPVSPFKPVAPTRPVGPVGPQIVEDLIADHGPYCDGANGAEPYIARIRKKYCVVGARLDTV